jgi:hypothetical protein
MRETRLEAAAAQVDPSTTVVKTPGRLREVGSGDR